MQRLKLEGRHWVHLHSPDEFMAINERIYNGRDPMYGLPVSTGSIDVPSPKEAGSTLHFVTRAITYVHKYGTQGNKYLRSFETPCVSFNQKQFGNLERKKGEPKFREPHGGQRIPGKAMIDFVRIQWKDVKSLVSAHVPIDHEDICQRDLMWGEEEMPLVIKHYPNSWRESLFESADFLGGEQGGIKNFNRDHFRALEWLPGFVESVGFHEAFRLLKNFGNPKTAKIGAFLELTKHLKRF